MRPADASTRYFEDYLARLPLSQTNGYAWGEGVRVQPPEVVPDALRNGCHPSLIEEPRAA